MSKEELVEKLAKVGINGEWINPDEYGFSGGLYERNKKENTSLLF